MKNIILSLFILFSCGAHSIYTINTTGDHQDSKENEKFPDVCQIICSNSSGLNFGTGILISPNVVITALHVVQQNDKSIVSLREFTLKFNDKYYPVREIISPPLGNRDVALLVLNESVEGVTPREIMTVQEGQQIPEISIAGYGRGRDIFSDEDSVDYMVSTILYDKLFKFKNHIQGPFTIELNSVEYDVHLAKYNAQKRYKRVGEEQKHNIKLEEFLHKNRQERMNSVGVKRNPDDENEKIVEIYTQFETDRKKREGQYLVEDAEQESEEGKKRLGKLFDLPNCLVLNSKIIHLGAADSGGPAFDKNGKLIGVAIKGELNDSLDIGKLREIQTDVTRKKHYNIGRLLTLAVCATPLAYAASAYIDSSWILSSAMSFAVATAMHAIANCTLGDLAPMNRLRNYFYDNVVVDTIKKSDNEIIQQIKNKGSLSSIWLAITDDLKVWIDEAVARSRE